MIREFVCLPEFDKNWAAAGLNDEDLREFQLFLCNNPARGTVIPGTGGLRKIRWLAKTKGKRSGIRVIYIDFVRFNKIYLLTAYTKNVKEDLSIEDRRQLKELVRLLESQLERKWLDETGK